MGLMWVSDLEPHGLYLSCCFAMSTQVLMMHRALLFIFLGQDSWVGILGLENPPLIGGFLSLTVLGVWLALAKRSVRQPQPVAHLPSPTSVTMPDTPQDSSLESLQALQKTALIG